MGIWDVVGNFELGRCGRDYGEFESWTDDLHGIYGWYSDE